MPAIMCTPALTKILKDAGKPCVHPFIGWVPRPLLRNWAATIIRAEGTDLVVALNERSYLTVVFPLEPIAAFRRTFTEALTLALFDHGIPAARIPGECAQVEAAPIVPLHDRTLRTAIGTAAFIAETEILCCDSLREVQWNVNQFPHECLEPLVPTQRVQLLYAPDDQTMPVFSRRAWQPGGRDCVEALLRTRAASYRIAAGFVRLIADLAGGVPEPARPARREMSRPTRAAGSVRADAQVSPSRLRAAAGSPVLRLLCAPDRPVESLEVG